MRELRISFLSFSLPIANCLLPFAFCLLPSAFCLLPSAFIHAQRNNFQNYSLEQGLPQATIYCIIQDDRGYLWLGTDGGGLCRFDGINFKTYNKKDGFKGDNIRSLLQDSKGRIWAGTKDEGIIIYDGLKFTNIGKVNGLAGDAVLCMFEDENGTVWAGTDNGGVNKIISHKDSFRIQVIDKSKGISNNSVFDIHKDKDGHLWLATFGGVNVLTFENDSFHIDHLRGGREIPSDQITSIAEDNDGALWFGTYDGGIFQIARGKKTNQNFKLDIISRKVSAFDPSNGFNAKTIWKIFSASGNELWFASVEDGLIRCRTLLTAEDSSRKLFEKFTDKEGLPGNQMLCGYQDKEKNIWIGTNGGGLCKFMGDVFSHYSEKDGLPGNGVQGIDMDSLENIWFGTSGGGLVQMDLKSGAPVCKNFTTKEGLSGNTILSVSAGKAARNQHLWMAVSNAGVAKYNGKQFFSYSEGDGLLDNSVYSILVDKNGIVWIGNKEGISRFDGVKFLNMDMETMQMKGKKDVNAIIQDKNGNLWFGTGGGLAKYSGAGDITTYDEVEGLLHKEIKCLAEDPFGNIWIGTNNGGLYRFDVFTDDKIKIRLVANDSLLSSNSVRAINFLDEKTTGNKGKEMVVGTDKGIDKITFDDKGKILKIRNYNATDGFVGVECNDNAMYRDADGNLWIGTVKGLTRFNPAAEIQNQNTPQIHITNIKLFFKEVDWSTRTDSILPWFNLPQSLQLSYSDNHLTFQYAAISLGNSQKVKYRYMLEGADEEWSPDRNETSVTFSGLSPGTYLFKVISAGANGLWNTEPAIFKFTINPPWYRHTFAYIIYIIVLVGGTYSFVKYRERALIREKKILEDKVVERTAEVVKQKEELEHQNEIIEEKNKNITDSINYAEKIQRAILPDPEKIKKALPESFILFQPRDIVSGDFFWYAEVESAEKGVVRNSPELLTPDSRHILLAAADCTGHGVPGAFMSMINTSLLNEAVNEKRIHQPNEILNEARKGIISALKQKGESGEQKDGMDVALISLKFQTPNSKLQENAKENSGTWNLELGTWNLQYAGANNSMYIIRKPAPSGVGGSDTPVLEEIDPDPMPVAISDRREDFKNNVLKLQKGDSFYLFTDGYADQFGGPKGKKFKYAQFKQLLLSIQNKSMDEQKEILDKTMAEWKGTLEQIDDILVIGVRV